MIEGVADPIRCTVAIIGAGFGGIGMAIRLKLAGWHDFIILEQADTVGGVWRDNTYPNSACDIPAHLYSLSFAPSANWSRRYHKGFTHRQTRPDKNR